MTIRLCAAALALTLPTVASAANLDLSPWLERPGVKLVAVEFYATWCKPCMEAVPRWKALHERYRAQGFRLIVVATQDPEGGCANPGWNPDDVVCDDDGAIAKLFGTSDRLPSAYLWSWQGRLLVRKGHVEEVEQAVQKWILASPRLSVEVGEVADQANMDQATLRDVVRAKLQDYGKMTVVATDEERQEIDRLKAGQFSSRYQAQARCEVGQELPANSLLKTRVAGDASRLRLYLQLFNLESGCLVTSSIVDWSGR